VEMNQEKRKALCSEVQKILAEELPYLPLWFNDVFPSTAARSARSTFFHWKLQFSCHTSRTPMTDFGGANRISNAFTSPASFATVKH